MNSLQLWDVLQNQDYCTSPHFLGVYACDRLPPPTKEKQFIVVNLDRHYNRGSHWVAIYLFKRNDGKYKGEYFDSYGGPPRSSDIKSYLDKFCINWTFNNVCLQDINSTVCGHYCIYFLVYRCRDYSLNEIVSFLKSISYNDFYVYSYVTEMYTIKYNL